MTNMDNLRSAAERIIRQRAFDPAQLEQLLSTKFTTGEDDLPNHFRYHAELNDGKLFTRCDLHSPKTSAAETALLVCDTGNLDITTKDVHDAYGESVTVDPQAEGSPMTVPTYLSIVFDNAKLSFGFDQATGKLANLVVEFRL